MAWRVKGEGCRFVEQGQPAAQLRDRVTKVSTNSILRRCKRRTAILLLQSYEQWPLFSAVDGRLGLPGGRLLL